MPVGVDESRNDDATRRVEDLCFDSVEPVADRGDASVLDQHVAAVEVADLRIHAQDMAAPEQNTPRHGNLPSVFVQSA